VQLHYIKTTISAHIFEFSFHSIQMHAQTMKPKTVEQQRYCNIICISHTNTLQYQQSE